MNIQYYPQSGYGILTQDQVVKWLDIVRNLSKTAIEIETEFPKQTYDSDCDKCFSQIKREKCKKCDKRIASCFNNNFIKCEFIISKVEKHKKTCESYSHSSLTCRDKLGCANCWNYNANNFCEGCNNFIVGCDFETCALPELKAKCKTCNKSPSIEIQLKNELNPTNSFDLGEGCVSQIKHDGSLKNGLELTIPGITFNYERNYKIYKKVIDELFKHSSYIDSHCGGHMHMFLDYNVIGNGRSGIYWKSSLDKVKIPDIIYANLYQLTRIFAPEIIWLTSTVTGRRYGYRHPRYIINNSPLKHRSIKELVRSIGDRYSMLNLCNTKFREDNSIKTFHVEFRVPDGCLSPSVWTSWGALFNAMFLRAIRMSQFGLAFIRDNEYWLESVRLVNLLENKIRLKNKDEDEIKKRTKTFLDNFQREITSLSPTAYSVLQKLAEKPVYKYSYNSLVNTILWKKIEEDLLLASNNDILDKINKAKNLQEKLRALLDSHYFIGLNKSKWVSSASTMLNSSIADIAKELDNIGVKYNETIGAFEVVV